MAFTPEQEAALLVLIAQPPKIISDLESEVSLNGDEVIPVEDGTGTFGATVNDIADYAKTKITFSPITIANNVTDANNDIDFSAGNFQFSDGTGIASLSALTKRLDATWVVGTNQGGLDTGAKANSTPYYCFAIYNPTSAISDALFSASRTSPTMPSGYTKKTYVGALHTDGSGNIRTGQYFYGKEAYRFIYNQPILDVSETPAATTVRTKTITAPARSFPIMPVFLSSSAVGGVDRFLLLTTTSATDITPGSSNFDIKVLQGANEVENNTSLIDYIQLSTSSQLRYRVNTTTCTVNIPVRGWTEYLN
jgi:hypothetical protein